MNASTDAIPPDQEGSPIESRFMETSNFPAPNHLLDIWLAASDQTNQQLLLTQLISEEAEPVIKSIIQYKLHSSHQAVDTQDLRSEVIVKLLQSLQRIKTGQDQKDISNFRNYVAVIAHNTCAEYFRHKSPNRHRLKDRLRVSPRYPIASPQHCAPVPAKGFINVGADSDKNATRG